MGKGGTGGRSPYRKLLPDMQGRSTGANLTVGNSNAGDDVSRPRKRVQLRSLVRENFTQGSVRGEPGDRLSYRVARQAKPGVPCRVQVPVG